MTVGYLEALAGIAVSLSILMAIAWMVPQRIGNSGWVDPIWTFSVGLTGAGSALWPLADSAPNPRQWRLATLVAIWSLRLGVRIARRTAGMTEDPRYAAFARALVHATGIPPFGERMLRSRGERYRDYPSRTSAFFPLPPQKGMGT